jgi:hypothetical protein
VYHSPPKVEATRKYIEDARQSGDQDAVAFPRESLRQ